MSIPAVLHAAADQVERWQEHEARRELKNGAGGSIFCLLFETAKQAYGWTVIQHLQRHLGSQLPGGQIQRWRETDRAAVVKVLREAAEVPLAPNAEVDAIRSRLDDFHRQLAEGMGWLTYDVTTLVGETVNEVGRLRATVKQLERQLAEEQRRARTARSGS